MNNFEWCRKAKYSVYIELGCYKIDEEHPLLKEFIEKEIDGEKYAVKRGVNDLEKNEWETSPARPFIITGTAGERWPVKPSNIESAYDVNPEDIEVIPKLVSTKDPSNQEFLIATQIPLEERVVVVPKWAFREDGTIDESQNMTSNLPDSLVSHLDGDFIVAKHIDGQPEYMELPEEIRNKYEIASLYDPRVINGSIMKKTYDRAKTKADIVAKYLVEEMAKGNDPFNQETEKELLKTKGYATLAVLSTIPIIISIGMIIIGITLMK